MAQRIKTVTRQLQSYTHPVTFKRIEAADYTLTNQQEKDEWMQAINHQDGFIFLIPHHSAEIKDEVAHSLEVCSHYLKNKPLLIIYYGVVDKFGDHIDTVELARSYDMPVIYNSVTLPYFDRTRAGDFNLFQKTDSNLLNEIEKLLYWAMGMKYTRQLISQQEKGATSSS